MKQSQLFTKTKKAEPKGELAPNAKLLYRAGYIDKLMAGVYTFLPLGFRVLKKIESIVREEMQALGAQEILMPSLHPKANWEKTGRWETLDDLFRFKSFYSKQDFALGGTHEEIIVPLAKTFISSYKDLPQHLYQIQDKFRDEKRAKSGLLRGREFLMKDLYSFHRDEKDLQDYYEKVKTSYKKIFEKAGIGEITYITFASGGTFSKYSHEFQTLTSAGEDTIYLCKKCAVAVNEEIITEQTVCPECGKNNFQKEKAVEVGNIFLLKTKYSQAFNLTFKDEKGREQLVTMGCYGLGLNRLMGAVAEIFHDEKGIAWPASVAPFAVHLLSLVGINQEAQSLYDTLQKQGIEVLYDDRQEQSAGEKLVDADLIGIPWRIVVSPRTLEKESAELKRRGEKEGKLFPLKDIPKIIHENTF